MLGISGVAESRVAESPELTGFVALVASVPVTVVVTVASVVFSTAALTAEIIGLKNQLCS